MNVIKVNMAAIDMAKSDERYGKMPLYVAVNFLGNPVWCSGDTDAIMMELEPTVNCPACNDKKERDVFGMCSICTGKRFVTRQEAQDFTGELDPYTAVAVIQIGLE